MGPSNNEHINFCYVLISARVALMSYILMGIYLNNFLWGKNCKKKKNKVEN